MKNRVRPAVKLFGEDGNAFLILGKCFQSAKDAGWTDEEWKSFVTEATRGGYETLLYVVSRHFDVY